MKKILIIRSSAIGDIVFVSNFPTLVKKTYPRAHITWLVEPGMEALIACHPHVDDIIVWPKAEWKNLWKSKKLAALSGKVLAFRKLLRSRQFDTVLDLQGLMKSGMAAWFTSAPRRIGLGSREGSQWLMTEVVPRGGDPKRIASEYLYLSQHLGLAQEDFIPELHTSSEAEAQALALLAEHRLKPGEYVVFAAFTTRPQKHWFVESWVRLAQLARQQTGLVPVLLGAPNDIPVAMELAGDGSLIVNLVGRTRIDAAMALVKHAGAVVGVDTGLTHMGIAFGVPTVAIFGSTCPYTDTRRGNARVIWLGLVCSPCRRNPTCGGAWTCLRDIRPEAVMNQLDAVLRLPA